MTFKKLSGQIHLWLGLSSGLVVFIVALTGALWTFESELSDLIWSYRTVAPQNKAYLLPSRLKEIAQPFFGEHVITNISYPARDKAVTLSMWEDVNGKEVHMTLYMNPYSGEVLHSEKNTHSFFDVVIELHTNLMLGNVGRQIVDYATLVFLLLIISGIVLWWPKNKAARKQRFRFKWKEGIKWKRKNYDLHNILGFYSCWIALFIVITGLAWGFSWMDKTLYYTSTLGAEYKEWTEVTSRSDTNLLSRKHICDLVYTKMIIDYRKPFESIALYAPAPKEKKSSYLGYINPSTKSWYKSQAYYFDQRTGELMQTELRSQLNNGQKLRAMYYDIHVGKILGLPGQFLVCFASLIVASLPITGFMIWMGRKKKEKKKGSVPAKPVNRSGKEEMVINT